MSYFNHAGTSWPKPPVVQDAVREAMNASPGDWSSSFDNQRADVARGFGISNPERLLLTPGCTSALAVAIQSLPWRAGERILTSSWEHRALAGPAGLLAHRGVEHVAIGPGEGLIDLAVLEQTLRAGRVRLVAVCAACNVTGALLPLDEVIALAHAHDALVLIDAAQSAGWLEYDVEALGADLFAFAGHKGPQAPWGVGGLYVAPRVSFAAAPDYCDTGSVDRVALAGLVAGLAWMRAPARAGRLAHARAVVEAVTARLEDVPGVALLGPRSPEARMPTVAFRAVGHRAETLASTLAAEGIVVSGGRQCAPLAHATLGTLDDGVVRVSAGPSTSVEDATRLAARLEKLLG